MAEPNQVFVHRKAMVKLDVRYDTDNIMLTLGMAFIGTFAGASLCEQYRLASISTSKERRHLVLFLVALTLGWGGTWNMHAAGLSSMKLYYGNEEIPIRFNAVIIVLAAIQSVLQTYIGLLLASTDTCFNKTRKEILDKFIARTSATHTLEEIKKMTKWQIFFIVCTHSQERITISGLSGGAGIAIMHYIMMHSMEFRGTIEYNPGLVAVSVLFAMFNGHAAIWTFFRLLSLFPSLDTLRTLVAALGVVAVSGMHYVGMTAVTFHYNPDEVKLEVPTSSSSISPGDLYSGAVTSCMLVVSIMLMFVLHDLRSWLLRTSTQLRQADKVITVLTRKLRAASKNQSTPLELVQYAHAYLTMDDTSIQPAGGSTSVAASPHSVATAVGNKRRKYHSLYNDYNEEEDAPDSDTGSNPSQSVRGADCSAALAGGGLEGRRYCVGEPSNDGRNAENELAQQLSVQEQPQSNATLRTSTTLASNKVLPLDGEFGDVESDYLRS
jgi:NO-binding membrane sensor protein with MHYT domain